MVWASAGDRLFGDDLLERVADIARNLAEADELDETLQRVVDLAQGYLEHCDAASLMVLRRSSRALVTTASTGVDAYTADRSQAETGEGPCLQAMQEHETVVVDDVDAEERWPRWRDHVSSLGFRSMLGLRLFVAEDTMGALNMYSRRPEAFDVRARTVATVFASHAAVAMKAAINAAGLEDALRARDVLGQAKGMLMEREGLSGQQAFDRLRELSMDRNVKVRDLADEIVTTGKVPAPSASQWASRGAVDPRFTTPSP